MTNLAQFDKLKADIQLYIAPVKDIVVIDKDSQDSAMEVAKNIKLRLKKIEDLRKELKAPYKKAGDDIDAYAKSISEILTAPSKHLETQFLAYNRKLEEVRLAEAARIRKEEQERQAAADKAAKEAMDLAAFEREIGNDEAAETAELTIAAEYERTEAAAIETVKAEQQRIADIRVKGVTLRWDFTIHDVSQIPIKYMVPNEVLIRKAIVDSKGEIQIPGVEAFQKESMTIR